MILEKIEARLRGRVGVGKALEEVKDPGGIIRGDEAESRLPNVLIWIGDAETSASDAKPMRYEDNRSMEVLLQVSVREKRAQDGPRKARRLALLAGSQLTKNDAGEEDLHLGIPATVVSIEFRRSGRGPSSRKEGLYTHVATYKVSYRAQR